MTLDRDGATLSGTPAAPGASSAPPDKDVLIRDMTRALRAAFKTSSMYRPDHPAFKSGVDDLLARLEALFAHLSPLTIGFTPHALFIDGRFWGDDPAYRDLARLFHFRKIKRMEIRPGLPREEFMRFASKIMLPVKAFIKEGGARAILERERIVHIALEVLDYSQILQGEGEEIKDIWPYLLMEAVEENDGGKLDELAGSFEKVVGRFNTEDLVQNEELHRNLAGFFRHLKASSAEKHRACAKKLLKSIASVRKTPPESKFENLKLLVSDLTEEDLASTLWEEIVDNEKFDSLGFSIFSRIIDRDRQAKVASSLQGLFHTENPRNRKPEVEEKIRILLSGTSTRLHSEIYRQIPGKSPERDLLREKADPGPERTKHVAFAKLFNRPSPYGLRNKQIIRNLRMVEESGIRDARPYIEPLAVRKDVWNRGLRREAGRILEAWREG
jgi:hypothetical protein